MDATHEILAQEPVKAINQMYDLLTRYQTGVWHEESPRDLLVQCAETGYSLLREETYVKALAEDARTLQKRAEDHRADIQVIMNGDHFEAPFLRDETLLLEQAGTNPLLIEVILQYCREAREEARRAEFDANKFHTELGELREEMRQLRTEFSKRGGRRLFQRLMDCFYGVCGCALVGLDASAFAASLGLAAASSAVSGAVGSAIVGLAITKLSADGPLWIWRAMLRKFREGNSKFGQAPRASGGDRFPSIGPGLTA